MVVFLISKDLSIITVFLEYKDSTKHSDFRFCIAYSKNFWKKVLGRTNKQTGENFLNGADLF
jgi:hypothetical protein